MRNGPCPCESGRKAKSCCLQADGGWYKAPVDLEPVEKTGYGHQKCYFRSLESCDTKISGEHYFPKAILEALDTTENLIKVSGVPWLEPGEVQPLAPGALTANVLCKVHNEWLSPLDAQLARFFKALRDLRIHAEDRPGVTLFRGVDIERALYKSVLGIFWGRIARITSETPIEGLKMGPGVLKLLYEPERWRPETGLGLFFLVNDDQTIIEKDQLAFRPVVNRKEKRVVGGEFLIRGFDFILGTSPEIRRYSEISRAHYRPGSFSCQIGKSKRTIILCWDDGLQHPPISLEFDEKPVDLSQDDKTNPFEAPRGQRQEE